MKALFYFTLVKILSIPISLGSDTYIVDKLHNKNRIETSIEIKKSPLVKHRRIFYGPHEESISIITTHIADKVFSQTIRKQINKLDKVTKDYSPRVFRYSQFNPTIAITHIVNNQVKSYYVTNGFAYVIHELDNDGTIKISVRWDYGAGEFYKAIWHLFENK